MNSNPTDIKSDPPIEPEELQEYVDAKTKYQERTQSRLTIAEVQDLVLEDQEMQKLLRNLSRDLHTKHDS